MAGPTVNKKSYDYACATVHINGKQYVGVSSIDYESKLEPGKQRGTSPQAVGWGVGDYDASGSMELFLADATEIRKELGDGYMLAEFPVTVNYGNYDRPLITDELVRCRITADSASRKNGNEGLVDKWTLLIGVVLKDGVAPLPNMQL